MKSQGTPWNGLRIIPLVVLERASDVTPLLDAFAKGGLFTIEIALRTPAALEAIGIASARKDFTVAAGTVLTAEQVSRSIDAGASFGLAPSSSPELLGAVVRHSWPFIPGFSTVSEAQQLFEQGFSSLKLFPADLLGGVNFCKALGSVMPSLRIAPSGGVGEGNLAEYLAEPNVFAVSGSWIAPKQLIVDHQFAEIERRAATAVSLVRSIVAEGEA